MDFFKLSGEDRYCPYCKRILVQINDDGSFDLSSDVALEGHHTATWSEDDGMESEEVTFEAQCLRAKCRIRGMISGAIRE